MSSQVAFAETLFAVERNQRVLEVKWATTEEESVLYYIEGWYYENLNACVPGSNYREGPLLGSELDSWLNSQGKFKPPRPETPVGELKGGFRLLICERLNTLQNSMAITKKSFARAEKALQLSAATLSTFSFNSGAYSSQALHNDETDELERVLILLKAPQKSELSNYGLSVTHHVKTGWTTGFLCGNGAVKPRDYDKYYGGCQLDQIRGYTKSSAHLWAHPLLLPVAVLRDNILRTERKVSMTEDMLFMVEGAIGVTWFGGLNLPTQHTAIEPWPASIKIEKVTKDLHSTAIQIVFLSSRYCWTQKSLRFLFDLGTGFTKDFPATARAARQISEVLSHDLHSTEGTARFVESLKERIQAQTTVLSSAANQQDNIEARGLSSMANSQNEMALKGHDLSLRIASSAKKDSIAMMTFTFITALFLPGTFIASLFSMPMFNWDGSPSGSSVLRLSNHFWIYWLVTLPLTVTVMGGWKLWYNHADRKWKMETGIESGGLYQ